MKEAIVEFEFLTPALLGGANPAINAEMRIPSIRGALRWWSRAMGYPTDAVFGCVKDKQAQASSVVLRDLSPHSLRVERQNAEALTGSQYDYFMWPLRKDARGVIPAGTKCKFQIMTRRQATLNDKVLKSFLLLGSLGTRSRRAYGSLWPHAVEIDGTSWKIPTTMEEFAQEVSVNVSWDSYCSVIQIAEPQREYRAAVRQCADFLKSFRCGSPKSGTPSRWGENDHDVPFGAEKVYRPALGLPLSQRYKSAGTFNTVIPNVDRLASPIHFKVIQLERSFVPIATVFNCPWANGTQIIVREQRGNRSFRASLDNELLDTISNPNDKEHRCIWDKSKIIGEFYNQ